jgi:hypothetical protein
MLIKGVTGGKDKGNPVEFAPEEKFPLAVKNFLSTKAPEGKLFIFTKVVIDKKTFTPRGQSQKGFANNSYLASGKVWYKTLDVKTDKLYPEKEYKFDIEFEDCCDNYGMPDLKLTNFELT